MQVKNLINTFKLMSHNLEQLEHHKNHILKNFLYLIGLPQDSVERFIQGKYNCLFYLPPSVFDQLPENIELYLPSGCRVSRGNPFSDECLNVQLRKIENTDSLLQSYAVSLNNLQVSKMISDWLERDSFPILEESFISDKEIAMSMALMNKLKES